MFKKLILFVIVLGFQTAVFAQSGAQLDSLYQSARTLAFDGKRDTSLKILDSLIGLKPDHFDARMLKARVLSWDKQYGKSKDECQQLNADYPEIKAVYILWSTVERWDGKPEMAKAVCLRGLNKFPEDRALILELSKSLPGVEEYEETLALNDSSIIKYPDALPEQKNKISVLMMMDSLELDSALFICDSLISEYPDDKELRMLRGKYKANVHLLDSALVEMDTVLSLDSAYLSAYHFRSNLFLWKSANDSAIWSAEEGLVYHPNDIPLTLMMAKAYLRIDSFPQSDSLVAVILNDDSLFYDAWAVALNSQLAQENYDSVLTATDELEPVFPADPEFKKLRVLSYAGKKKYKKAIDELAETTEEADSLDGGSQVLYTKFHYWDRQSSKAMDLSDRFIDQHPEEFELYRIKALIHKSWFEKKKALKTIDDGLDIDSTNGDLLELKRDIEENLFVNSLALYAGYDDYNGHVTDAYGRTSLTAEYLRHIRRHTLIGRVSFADRFGNQGIQLELDGYLTVTDWLYFYLNGGISNEFLFPWYRWTVEPFFTLPAKFEASVGLRYMGYRTSEVLIYTGSIGYYPGNWWLSIRPYISSGNNGVAQTWVFKARRFFKTPITFLELQLGAGANPDNSYLDQAYDQLYDARSYNIGLTYQQKLNRRLHLKTWVIFEQYQPQEIPDFTILSLNAGLWWRF